MNDQEMVEAAERWLLQGQQDFDLLARELDS